MSSGPPGSHKQLKTIFVLLILRLLTRPILEIYCPAYKTGNNRLIRYNCINYLSIGTKRNVFKIENLGAAYGVFQQTCFTCLM